MIMGLASFLVYWKRRALRAGDQIRSNRFWAKTFWAKTFGSNFVVKVVIGIPGSLIMERIGLASQ